MLNHADDYVPQLRRNVLYNFHCLVGTCASSAGALVDAIPSDMVKFFDFSDEGDYDCLMNDLVKEVVANSEGNGGIRRPLLKAIDAALHETLRTGANKWAYVENFHSFLR